ncbi:protein of unknown function [Actinomadura meyerae]|uniref:DUF397 domain-containing protein n=1 Tax=Actinomadura meyerae TaxID=240840 RepID=A0A239P942_9ACTN|nr:DUF397 domain-containing protein [Actinomadura meyerae]SNT62939.1 protein of unknown function [Actinomadura meyerae]
MNLLTELSQAHWRKASQSSSTGSDCVEVAAVGDVIAVRDSKRPDGSTFFVDRRTWRELTERVSKGDFDL